MLLIFKSYSYYRLFIENTYNFFHLKVALVEEGLATVHPTAERSEHFKSLKSAEDSAKSKKLKRWLNYVEEEKETEVEEEEKVYFLQNLKQL